MAKVEDLLNQWIDEFNKAKTKENKHQALQSIAQIRNYMNYIYPYGQISYCIPYQEQI